MMTMTVEAWLVNHKRGKLSDSGSVRAPCGREVLLIGGHCRAYHVHRRTCQ